MLNILTDPPCGLLAVIVVWRGGGGHGWKDGRNEEIEKER